MSWWTYKFIGHEAESCKTSESSSKYTSHFAHKILQDVGAINLETKWVQSCMIIVQYFLQFKQYVTDASNMVSMSRCIRILRNLESRGVYRKFFPCTILVPNYSRLASINLLQSIKAQWRSSIQTYRDTNLSGSPQHQGQTPQRTLKKPG